MGSLNSDCWYMYTLKDFSKPISSEPDQTIEILMSDLDQEIMKIFHQTNSHTAKEAREKSKIDQLMPNMKIDDYLFSPCGYSLNGVLLNVSLWQREMRIRWQIEISGYRGLRPGRICHHPHHSWTRLQLCQLWVERASFLLLEDCHEYIEHFQPREIYLDNFCYQGEESVVPRGTLCWLITRPLLLLHRTKNWKSAGDLVTG